MVLKDIIDLYSEVIRKVDSLRSMGKMESYWLLKQVVHIITTGI
jgi:hypothetical protein